MRFKAARAGLTLNCESSQELRHADAFFSYTDPGRKRLDQANSLIRKLTVTETA